jgi:hypothetical protein
MVIRVIIIYFNISPQFEQFICGKRYSLPMAKTAAFRLKPWQAGLIIGLVASLAQATYYLLPTAVAGVSKYKVSPPAYGFCMYCHVRDAVNWVVQGFVPSVSPAPIAVIAPTMTVFGVLLGAFIAAKRNGQFAWRQTIKPSIAVLAGAGFAVSAALLGACTLRIVIRAAYLEPFAYVGLGAIAVGVAIGTYFFIKRGSD